MNILQEAIDSKYDDESKTFANVRSEMRTTIFDFVMADVGWAYQYHQFCYFSEKMPKPDGAEFEFAIGYIDKTRVKRGTSKKVSFNFENDGANFLKVCNTD